MLRGYTQEMSGDTQDPKLLQSNTTKWLTAAVVGIGSGIGGFITKVHNEFYDNCKSFPRLQKEFETHSNELNKLVESRINGEKTGDQYIKEAFEKKQALARKIDGLTQQLGIESETFFKKYTIGSVQRFKTLSNNTRAPVIFSTVTAAIIGAAGSMMFFNSAQMRHKLDNIHSNITQDRER